MFPPSNTMMVDVMRLYHHLHPRDLEAALETYTAGQLTAVIREEGDWSAAGEVYRNAEITRLVFKGMVSGSSMHCFFTLH